MFVGLIMNNVSMNTAMLLKRALLRLKGLAVVLVLEGV